MASNRIAVGSVVLFGGDAADANVAAELASLGWLPCDGAAYVAADWPDLFAAIGTVNGGDGTIFNVPDLRDRLARGRDGEAGNDPDATTRTAAAPGGATGDAVGSLQPAATAMPNRPWAIQAAGLHAHSYKHLSHSEETTDPAVAGGTSVVRHPMPRTSSAAGAHSHAISGGDAVTMPKTLPLHWIIRAVWIAPAQLHPIPPTTPTGAICGFAGAAATPGAGWLACDGASRPVGNAPSDLAMTIGTNFGGDGTDFFDLPDFRGRFQRGTDHGASQDPDAALRGPSAEGGNTGDAVGSVQESATANPQTPFVIETAGEHAHSCSHVPGEVHHTSVLTSTAIIVHHTNAVFTTEAGEHSHDLTGGDSETRPENLYLDWLIAANDVNGDAPPVGSILPFGGDMTDQQIALTLRQFGWYPCFGGAYRKESNAELYAVIGEAFFVQPETLPNPNLFYLPDLRGLFAVGAAPGRALGARQLFSQTAMPANGFATSAVGDHVHEVPDTYASTVKINIVSAFECMESKSSDTASSKAGAHDHMLDTVAGGDSESRPVNVYVDYIIRYR